MMRLVALAAMACVVVATKEPVETQDTRKCDRRLCDDLESYRDTYCLTYEVARKIFKAGAMDPCCPTFKCEIDPAQPCESVTCKVPNNNQTARDDWCNDNIYPNDAIWNNLSPDYGTKYSYLVRPAADRAGRCCDEFRCKTDYEQLCENRNLKTPCPGESTCPLCHTAVVRRAKNPEEGRCCDEIECVKDDVCMCTSRENTDCNEPNCVTEDDYILQYPITIFEADPSMDNCCPRRSCQNDLTQICLFEREQTGWNETLLCNECEILQIITPANLNAGRCYPEYQCIPNGEACCGFNTTACPAIPNDAGSCESYEPYNSPSSCCTEYSLQVNLTCVCDIETAAEPCEFTNATAYREAKCPDMTRDKSGNGVNLYEVRQRPANPAAGVCCDSFTCVKTSTAQLEVIRKQKGPAATQRP